MLRFASLVAGFVFGIGLIVSGMANPAKVLGFLDLAGAWDPSLAFVMGGAVLVGIGAFSIARRRTQSLLGADMKLPTARDVDRRLVVGSTLFGIGWGVVGFCPGPALVALGMGEIKAVVFVVAMLVGMALFEWLEQRQRPLPVPVPVPVPVPADQVAAAVAGLNPARADAARDRRSPRASSR